jgi:hypothetical protein
MSSLQGVQNYTINLAVWVEPEVLYVKIDLAGGGKIRFVVNSVDFIGTPLAGWSSTWPTPDQWRAHEEALPDNQRQTVWLCGRNGGRLTEKRMIELLFLAKEDMSREDVVKHSRWTNLFLLVEAGLHGCGAFGILDDLALRVPAAKRQFKSRVVLDSDGGLLVSAMSLDNQVQLVLKPGEAGIEYEMVEYRRNGEPAGVLAGLWPIRKINHETRDHEFHQALDKFITMAPPAA